MSKEQGMIREKQFNAVQHSVDRNNFFAEIDAFWPDLYDMEYALYDCLKVTRKDVAEMRKIAERAFTIFQKTAHMLRSYASDPLLEELDYPRSTLTYIRKKTLLSDTVIGRFDFVKTTEGFKILELNADTPTFIKECFVINGKVVNKLGYEDPNAGTEAELAAAVKSAILETARARNLRNPHIVFTSHSDHEEDLITTIYLLQKSAVKAKFVPLSRLVIDENGLYDEESNRIDILYRQTYPIEHLANDSDEHTKMRVGEQLIQLVIEDKLSLINPPSAFLLQSKAVMAIIWGLMEEDSDVYTTNEKRWIRQYFLPTYLEKDTFIAEGVSFVEKPSFGREGDTIKIYDGNGNILNKNVNENYSDSTPVFQKHVEMPKISIKTEKGIQEARQLFGCFVINGKGSAIGVRAGAEITGNESCFMPIGYKKYHTKGEQQNNGKLIS
ncbi:glutathionylspermidine synthase family protein [Cohnella sp.]|uniref:glutathionylspermidine synthase family protein n=1 Tax=Cohnella sp. TaxID=1883426 RepID=UPI0035663C13